MRLVPKSFRVAGVVCALLAGSCGATDDRCARTPEGKVSLPRDDGTHQSLVEWWYWTGHLVAEPGRWFGFELVFFHVRSLEPGFVQMAHHTIIDTADRSFHYTIDQAFTDPPQVADRIELTLGNLQAQGAQGRDHLRGTVDGYELDLGLESKKAPVFHHGDGYIDYDFGGNTYYYSRERMQATGTLTVGGSVLPVTGSAWFDHQWGEMTDIIDQGWDWFALQLDDDREIMVFRLRDGGEEKLRGGSYTDSACASTRLEPQEVAITPAGEWTSPRTGCTYPLGWTIRVRDQDFTLTPVMEDQELSTSFPVYWEGAAEVTGAGTGRAFIELTNYCR